VVAESVAAQGKWEGGSESLRVTGCNALSEMSFFVRFDRITIDPAVATGKACIRNLLFPVLRLLGLLASGETGESILKAHPYLESSDIDES